MILRPAASLAMPGWWFRLDGNDRAWALFGAGVLAVSAVGGAFARHWQGAQTSDVLRSLDAVQQEIARTRADADAAANVPASVPWWSHLAGRHDGRPAASDQLSTSAATLATEFNVRLVRMTFATPSQAVSAPYRRVDVRVEARGTYPDLKSWLAQLFARHSRSLTLKGLDLRRAELAATQSVVEASIDMRLFEPAAGTSR